MRVSILLLSGALLIFGSQSCKRTETNKSILFDKAESKGRISRELEEASGLTASISNPGYLWTLNDSGNPAEIFLLNDKADIVMTCKLGGIKNRDWEDLTILKTDSVNYLYIGEIGDNEAKYDYKYLFRVKEPVYEGVKKISIGDITTYLIQLPDGKRDMESIAIDQLTGDMYLISKREDQVNVYLQRQRDFVEGDTLEPKKIMTLPYHNVVAANFSFDGKELLVKTYDEIYYWRIADSVSIAQTLRQEPVLLDYKPEPQGEAIAWALNGEGFYTLSESVHDERAKLYFYKRR